MMEGMISIQLWGLEPDDILEPTSKISTLKWRQGLITKLIEATHGQWIYRNLTMHDRMSGLIATHKKELLMQEIETQMDKGGEGLEEQDKWMLDINLNNVEGSSGEHEAYWLLAIKTARERFRIQARTN